MADHIPAAAREAARHAVQVKLAGLMPGQTGINLANEVADAALDAAYPEMATHFLQILMGGSPDQAVDSIRNA